MKQEALETIAAEFDSSNELYSDFTQKLHMLFSAILAERGISVHSVTCRVKDRDSVLKKISQPEKEYSHLSEITDLAGIRITTFFADDVDRIAALTEHEFNIDWANSIDKRLALDPDRFGYLSLHHVLELSETRASLIEYHRFAGLKAEVQTRSILQHAWAEIEHDLGYKTISGVPNEVRRRFSRLAGLLEIADQEFIGIRESLATYENTVAEKIERVPEIVEINKASLASYLHSSKIVKRVDTAIARINKGSVAEVDLEHIEYEITRLTAIGFQSIAELDQSLEQREPLIIAFASGWLAEAEQGLSFAAGVSLLYLAYTRVAETNDVNLVARYLQGANIGDNFEQLAERVVSVWRGVVADEAK